MYLRAIGRHFTQMDAYFLIMNSKRCTIINEVMSYECPLRECEFEIDTRGGHCQRFVMSQSQIR